MLTVLTNRRTPTCSGGTRRDFLTLGGLAAGGMGLSWLLNGSAGAAPARPGETSVIWLWLGGGPSQFETFDPKMDAPVEFRSTTGEVPTSLPGITFGGTFPELAKRAHRVAVVRSFAHSSSSHTPSTHWMNTGMPYAGFNDDNPQIAPSLGSVAAFKRGTNHPVTGMPSYIKLGGPIRAEHPAYLGRGYGPFDPSGAVENMVLRTPLEHLGTRRDLLRNLDQLRRDLDLAGLIDGMAQCERQALDLLTGQMADAFDLSREDPRVVAAYGDEVSPSKGTKLGQCLLLARRMCEAGCAVVNVGYGGWDHHNVNGTPPVKQGFEAYGPPLDRALSAFIDDLYARGLEKKILLVACGEFGRTPRISVGKQEGGRDHWGPLTPLLVIGGGLRMGQAIGRSNDKGEQPVSQPYGPGDLFATIFHVLGVDPRLELPASTKIGDRPFVEKYRVDGRPIPEFF